MTSEVRRDVVEALIRAHEEEVFAIVQVELRESPTKAERAAATEVLVRRGEDALRRRIFEVNEKIDELRKLLADQRLAL
jgi:hypothetical protein